MSQEGRGHYAEWEKQISKAHTRCDSTCTPSSKLQVYTEGEHINGCRG